VEVFEKVVRHCEDMVGKNHVYTFVSTYHLGQSLAELGRLEEAREKFENTMNGFEQVDPKQDLEVARCKEGIATVLRYSGSLSEAESMYEQVVKMGKIQKGKERDVLIALCWEGIAEIWKSKASEMDGKDQKVCLKKALKFSQQTLESRNKAYGPGHPEVRRTAELAMGILERLGEDGKVARRLKSEYGSGELGTIDRETESGDLISLG
jgi:hypothetical protein